MNKKRIALSVLTAILGTVSVMADNEAIAFLLVAATIVCAMVLGAGGLE